ncbi:NAD(P)-binding domain-containing protein [Rossellomorea sp. GAMAL-10_SWC]
MKIGIIGNGQIGNVIANRLIKYNHEITDSLFHLKT